MMLQFVFKRRAYELGIKTDLNVKFESPNGPPTGSTSP
jgi:hypothetical protein